VPTSPSMKTVAVMIISIAGAGPCRLGSGADARGKSRASEKSD
jgi:hypothetical protein